MSDWKKDAGRLAFSGLGAHEIATRMGSQRMAAIDKLSRRAKCDVCDGLGYWLMEGNPHCKICGGSGKK